MPPAPRYSRILLKISGEALAGENGFGISQNILRFLADEIGKARACGAEVALVAGGGNFVRGETLAAGVGIDRVSADYMGMLATIINGMAIQAALEGAGITARLHTALRLEELAAPYIRDKAVRQLEQGKVVIFSGGTGNPFFTTDTAAALRAAEIGAGALFKGTKVDGVYSADPAADPAATRYATLTFGEAITAGLKVMDATALTLCREHQTPLHVYNFFQKDALCGILRGGDEGTLVTN